MGTLFKIAARNVLRNKRRTAITGIVMMFGIGLFIYADSILKGMDRMTIDNMVQYTDSFLKIRTPEYVSNIQGNPLDYGIPDPEAVIKTLLSSDLGIKAAAPRTRFVARLSNYTDEIPVIATAVDPRRDGTVLKLADKVSQGVWLEMVNLVIPTLNDNPSELTQMCKWITTNLGTDVPLHFTRFHPQYLLKNLPPTPIKTLDTAYQIAKDAGINYVYVGNVPGHIHENTVCLSCNSDLIVRNGYHIVKNTLKNGKCPDCSTPIQGVWS